MTRGLLKRRKPIQERLEKIKKIILKDASSRIKTAKEMANNYGVSYGALLIYFKESRIKKLRKLVHYYVKSNPEHKSKIEDIRNYIRENNITKRQIELVILSICEDVREEKARRMT